jgi:hypothetical protein
VAELREAVGAFVDLYNEQWLLEKNGFVRPSATREACYAGQARGSSRMTASPSGIRVRCCIVRPQIDDPAGEFRIPIEKE